MTPTVTFACSICGEPSQMICVYCTKDACANHLCERCRRCSDCCECEVRLEEPLEHQHPGAPEAEVFVEAVIEDAAAQAAIGAEPAPDETAVIDTPAGTAPEPEAATAGGPVPPPAPEITPAPPLEPHPDLSKLFAPEDAPPRVFPTSHGPIPVSNNQPEGSPEPESDTDEEQSNN